VNTDIASFYGLSPTATFLNQSLINTGACGALFLGAIGAFANSAEPLFDTVATCADCCSEGTTDSSPAGRGRGSGIDDVAPCLGPVPVTWRNQVEISCAISDRGDRASGGDSGTCARIGSGVSRSRTNKQNVLALKTPTCTIFSCCAVNTRQGLIGIGAMLGHVFTSPSRNAYVHRQEAPMTARPACIRTGHNMPATHAGCTTEVWLWRKQIPFWWLHTQCAVLRR